MLRRFVDGLKNNLFHFRSARAALEPAMKIPQCSGFAEGNAFYTTIVAVAHPATEAERLGDIASAGAKGDALDASRNQKTACFMHGYSEQQQKRLDWNHSSLHDQHVVQKRCSHAGGRMTCHALRNVLAAADTGTPAAALIHSRQ